MKENQAYRIEMFYRKISRIMCTFFYYNFLSNEMFNFFFPTGPILSLNYIINVEYNASNNSIITFQFENKNFANIRMYNNSILLSK